MHKASHQQTQSNKSCVVIGAGLAGLSAAYQLTKKNWEVTVVEARDRIGGRVFTDRFRESPELYCELGGEWVGDDHDEIKKLCQELKLDLIPHHFRYSFAELGSIRETLPVGAWPFEKRLQKKLEKEMKKLGNASPAAQNSFDRQDWWTFLRCQGFSDQDLLRRDLMDSTDFGETIRQAGAFSAASEYYGPGSDTTDEMDWRIAGGNTRLVNALAERVGLHVIYNSMEVQRIEQEGDWVSVYAVDNRTELFAPPRPNPAALPPREQVFKARYCVCTVPARVLDSIKFVPPLPESQALAARDLQYCRIMKTVLLFPTRFWEKRLGKQFSCFTDGTSDFIFAASLGQPGTQGILCSYAIGDKADDLASRGPVELRALIAADLAKLFPGEDTAPIAAHRYAWQQDKYTQGAYAFYRPGQWFPVRTELAKHHKSIYFAGEHIADEQGFMDGAVDTGQIAARDIEKAYKKAKFGNAQTVAPRGASASRPDPRNTKIVRYAGQGRSDSY
ncbi:MAG TPA: NAD(P)/FAD-dependent oxidoreductase [Candidatus Acidoferrales bacterium]